MVSNELSHLYNIYVIWLIFKYIILGKKRVESFLDLLIGISKQNPEIMTDSDIREEVDTFLFEGHDTSSTAMTLTLVLLGIHQDIQVNILK